MSRSRKKHPCCGWGRFKAAKWKQKFNSHLRAKNKQNLRHLSEDPEGDSCFVEDSWTLKDWIGEKDYYRGYTWKYYYNKHKEDYPTKSAGRGWKTVPITKEEEKIILWEDWIRWYLGK